MIEFSIGPGHALSPRLELDLHEIALDVLGPGLLTMVPERSCDARTHGHRQYERSPVVDG